MGRGFRFYAGVWLVFSFSLPIFFYYSEAEAKEIIEELPYHRIDIAEARFGTRQRQQLLAAAYGLKERLAKLVVGQSRLGQAMQDRSVQYLESFGTRKKDPIALHMIGLTGIESGRASLRRTRGNVKSFFNF